MSAPPKRLPILGVAVEQVARRALVVGDPDRVGEVARLLDEAVEVGRCREYVTVTGHYRGTPVTVASHGVGASGAAVCFEELARAGVTHLLRAGTCGGLQPRVQAGDLVVAIGAERDDGLTDRLAPPGWPAVADPALTRRLAEGGQASGHRTHTGVVVTTATFYPDPHESEPRWLRSQRLGALAIEMELAALLVVAHLHGIAAGGVLAVDGNLLTAAEDMSDYDPGRAVVADAKAAMLRVALDALVAGADPAPPAAGPATGPAIT